MLYLMFSLWGRKITSLASQASPRLRFQNQFRMSLLQAEKCVVLCWSEIGEKLNPSRLIRGLLLEDLYSLTVRRSAFRTLEGSIPYSWHILLAIDLLWSVIRIRAHISNPISDDFLNLSGTAYLLALLYCHFSDSTKVKERSKKSSKFDLDDFRTAGRWVSNGPECITSSSGFLESAWSTLECSFHVADVIW